MPFIESANPSLLSRKHTVVPQSTVASGPGERATDVSHFLVSRVGRHSTKRHWPHVPESE